jgi:leader peptidase (prepilin peptidase)/N-methyltransferase
MDNLVISIFLFFLGASFASFILVFKERGISLGRSECVRCKKKLTALELVPVLSYIFLLGRCFSCREKIPKKLFIGEVLLGSWYVSSFLYTYMNFGNDFYMFILSLFFGTLFYYLVDSDLETMEVESKLLYLFVSFGIVGAIYSFFITSNFYNILIPILISAIFYFINYFKNEALGEADAYIYLSLGLFFGMQFILSLFLYSVWLGSLYGIFYLIFINKKIERGVRVPFLPIIFVSCLIIFVTNYHVIKISDILILNEIISS